MSQEDRAAEEYANADWERIHNPGIIRATLASLDTSIGAIAVDIDSILDKSGSVEPQLQRLQRIIDDARSR